MAQLKIDQKDCSYALKIEGLARGEVLRFLHSLCHLLLDVEVASDVSSVLAEAFDDLHCSDMSGLKPSSAWSLNVDLDDIAEEVIGSDIHEDIAAA